MVHQWTSPQPNDLFGLSAIITPDVNSDGIADVAIAIPNAFDDVAGTRVGLVVIKSGASGATLTAISGTPLERFGLALFASPPEAPSLSPTLTVLVEALDPQTNSPSGSFTFQSFDAFSGAFLAEAVQAPEGFTAAAAGLSLATHIRAAGPGDLNASGSVTPLDLSVLANNYGASVDPVTGQLLELDPSLAAAPTGDTNGDGVVDSADLNTVLGSIGQHFGTQFEFEGEELTEAEASAVEAAFGNASPQGLDCKYCALCGRGWCQVIPDLYGEVDGDGPPEFDNGTGGTGPPEGGTGPGGGGSGPGNENGDSDGDGVGNTDDCDSSPEKLFLLPGMRLEEPDLDFAALCMGPGGVAVEPTLVSVIMTDPTCAKFELDGQLVPAVSAADLPRCSIVGLKSGFTVARAVFNPPCCSSGRRIVVGGEIRLEFDGPPTFNPRSAGELGESGVPASAPQAARFPNIGGGSYPAGRGRVPPEVEAAALEKEPVSAHARIVVLNAEGDPLPHVDVRLLSREGLFAFSTAGAARSPIFLSTTDSDGEIRFTITADDLVARELYFESNSGVPPEEWSIAVGRIALLVGDLAQDYDHPNGVDPETLEQLLAQGDQGAPSGNTHALRKLRLLGYGVRTSITPDTALPIGDSPPQYLWATCNLPAFNQVHYWIAHHALTGSSLEIPNGPPPSTSFNISVYDIVQGNPGDPPVSVSFTAPSVGYLDAVSALQSPFVFTDAIRITTALPQQMLAFEPLSTGFPGDPQSQVTAEGVLAAFGVGAIAVGEIAIGFVPGGDLVDLIREFGGALFLDQRVNWWTVGFSAFGLLCDGAYFVPALQAVGAAGNTAVLVLKRIAKLDDIPGLQGVVRHMSDAAGSVKGLGEAAIGFTGRVYNSIPGANNPVAAFNAVGTKIARAVSAPINAPLPTKAAAIVWFFKKPGKVLSDEAGEGAVFLHKLQDNAGLDNLVAEFGDDVAEHTLEALAKIGKRQIDDLSEDAVRGVAVAAEAVGINSDAVRVISDCQLLTPEVAERLFSATNSLENVDGLPSLVTFARNNSSQAASFKGAVFEAHVGKACKHGEIAQAGQIQRVSLDGDPVFKNTDILTENACIQVKAKADGSAFDIRDLGGFPDDLAIGRARDYVRELAIAANQNGRIAVWATNGGVTTQFRTNVLDVVEAEIRQQNPGFRILDAMIPE